MEKKFLHFRTNFRLDENAAGSILFDMPQKKNCDVICKKNCWTMQTYVTGWQLDCKAAEQLFRSLVKRKPPLLRQGRKLPEFVAILDELAKICLDLLFYNSLQGITK